MALKPRKGLRVFTITAIVSATAMIALLSGVVGMSFSDVITDEGHDKYVVLFLSAVVAAVLFGWSLHRLLQHARNV